MNVYYCKMSTTENSMLIYSEKMKRISRQRLAQGSSISSVPSKDQRKLLIHRTREDQSSPKPNLDGKSVRPLRSFSDASKYKSLRDKHLHKITKKHSLDMTDSDLLKGGVRVEANDEREESRMISGAWESPNGLYKRQRRRGITVMPKLESLNISENPLYASDAPDIDVLLKTVNPVHNKDMLASESYNRIRNDCPSEKGFNTVMLRIKDESQAGITETDSENSDQEYKNSDPSEISQMVLESFSRGNSDLSVDPLSGSFKDTSAAELKLLSRRRNRLSSSSAPSSPNESGDEDDGQNSTRRRRTQSESIPCHSKPLRSVLKKRTSFAKKHKPVEKRVSFISTDTIRVISRSSSFEMDTTPPDGACQSQNTIVVIRD